jgi:hypothetical protein
MMVGSFLLTTATLKTSGTGYVSLQLQNKQIGIVLQKNDMCYLLKICKIPTRYRLHLINAGHQNATS